MRTRHPPSFPPTFLLCVTAFLLLSVLAAGLAGCSRGAQEGRTEVDGGSADRKAADAPDDASPRGPKELREIPPGALPPQTRPRPDPAREPYVKEPVHVRFEETIRRSAGPEGPPGVRVIENYLAEYLRRAGHPVTASPEEAVHRVEGSFRGEFDSTLNILEKVIGWKYKGSAEVRVLDRAGKEIERFEVPELLEESGKDEESAALDLERHMAKILWDHLHQRSSTFSSPRVIGLINSLALEGSTGADAGIGDDPAETGAGEALTTEDVVQRLADIGLSAVPYLLEALDDERVVSIPTEYPGSKTADPTRLRIYHIADKALEEIFQKLSRMSLELSAEDPQHGRLRKVIVAGWENEWKRFCKPYRESPNARRPPAKAGAEGNSKGS